MTKRSRLTCGGLLLAALVPTGCGSAKELPPSPEPAVAPAVSQKPAGRVVRVGNMPEGAVFDPVTRLVAVGLRDPAVLALVDADSGRVVRRVRLPAAPRHLQLERPGGPVLVPAEDAGVLARVALPGGRVTLTRVGRQPHDATAVAGRVFVGNELGDTVSVIEGNRVIRTLAAPVHPGGVAAPTPGRVATVAVRERKVELWDARSLRSLGRVDAGVGSTHVVSDGEGRLFVADTDGDALLLYRARSRLELVCRLNVSGKPYALAIDQRRHRLWVGLTSMNRVVEFRLRGDDDPRAVASYPTVRQPNTLAVDPKSGRVFVAGKVEGTLQIFHPRR